MDSSDKIQTLHPDPSKKGANISKDKYNVIRTFILDLIDQNEIISYEEINDLAVEKLTDTFDGSVVWYIVTVKLDLEARKIIKRVKGKGSHKVCRT